MKTRTITLNKDEIISLLFLVKKGLPRVAQGHASRTMIGTALGQLDKAYNELKFER